MKDLTLSEVLEQLGYTHKRNNNGRHAIYNENGKYVGNMRAGQCWDYLRKEGLYE